VAFSATELWRVSGQQPAVVEHQSLPAACPVRGVATGPGPLQTRRPPKAGVRPETPRSPARKASTSASKVSCTALPGEENSKDFCYLQNENTILVVRKLQSLTREPRGGRGPQWQGVSPVQSVHAFPNRPCVRAAGDQSERRARMEAARGRAIDQDSEAPGRATRFSASSTPRRRSSSRRAAPTSRSRRSLTARASRYEASTCSSTASTSSCSRYSRTR